MWLEKYLKSTFTGTLVVVSHDRHFLNEVVTDVVHFHNNTLATYRGDITNFEAVVQENKIRQKRQREQQEAKRAHLQKYIDIHAQAGENGPKVQVLLDRSHAFYCDLFATQYYCIVIKSIISLHILMHSSSLFFNFFFLGK